MMNRLLTTMIALLATTAVASAQYYGGMPQKAESLPSKEVTDNVRIDQKLDAQLPIDLQFKDEAGKSVTLRQLMDGKPTVLTLAYYECPMLCTQVLTGVLNSLRVVSFDVGDEYEVLTVSINPHEKKGMAAEKKANYVRRYGREGAEKGWHFLTGDSLSIAKLADAVGFRYVYDPNSKQYAHASGLMVLTPEGRVSAYQMGVEFSPKDLKLSLMNAADGKIGSAVDKLVLLCYDYDPTSGKYGFAITTALKIGGVLTMLGVGGFVLVARLRERRGHQAVA